MGPELGLFRHVRLGAELIGGGASGVDLNVLNNLLPTHPNGITSTVGRTLASPQTLVVGEATITLLVYGQSNSIGAAIGSLYTPTNTTKLQNLNPDDGAIYQAIEPLLGGGVAGGAWTTQLADTMITDGKCARCIIETMGIGATFSADWAAGGSLNHRITAAVSRYRAKGLQASTRTLILRHQGESDTNAGTLQAAYAATLASEIATWQALLPGVPIFIGKVSYYNGTTSAGIIAAQNAAIDNVNTFSLGDFDGIVSGSRIGNVDYNGTGMTTAAGIAKTAIYSYLSGH